MPFSALNPIQHHLPDLYGFLKMIQLVGLNPPGCGFHQGFRIVIFVGLEGVEGNTHRLTFLLNFLITHLDDLFS